MNDHHIYGPSTLDSLAQCVRFKYDSEKSPAAGAEGTMLHAAFETGELTGLSDEQKTDVQTIRMYVESLKHADDTKPEDWEDHREIKLVLEGLTHGRADCVLYHPDSGVVHVVDAKFTRLESPHDMQLRTYGAAFAENLVKNGRKVTRIVLHVVAPRIGPPVISEFDPHVLISATREWIEALYSRVEDPFTQPTPQSDLCPKCARAAKCPALCKEVVAIVVGSGFPLPSTFDPTKAESPRDKAILQLMAGAAEQWAKLVKSENTKSVSENGIQLPGFKLVRRSTGARLPKENAAEFARRLADAPGSVDAVELLGCANMSIGDVVSLIALKTGDSERGVKAELLEMMKDIMVEGYAEYLAKEKRISDADLVAQIQ